jgi:hypoxanthine phosphoribosyltransferase
MEFSDVEQDLTEIVFTEDQVKGIVADLARRIEADYEGSLPLLVGVLRGAVMVMADLSRELRIPVEMDWMAVSSYGAGTQSSGVVRILKDLDTDITGRRVLIVEDIIDSGLTLSWLKDNLATRGAESVEICALLRKPDAVKVEVDVRYVGADIPNKFVVGYGLDYAEAYRHLKGVAVLAPHIYS